MTDTDTNTKNDAELPGKVEVLRDASGKPIRAILSDDEINQLLSCPEVLRIAADCQEVKATEAESIDPVAYAGCIQFHDTRRKSLQELADEIESHY